MKIKTIKGFYIIPIHAEEITVNLDGSVSFTVEVSQEIAPVDERGSLTEENKKDIITRILNGDTQTSLAKEYGVTQGYISQLWSNKETKRKYGFLKGERKIALMKNIANGNDLEELSEAYDVDILYVRKLQLQLEADQ